MKFIDLATQSALEAGKVLLGYFGKIDKYELKSPKSVLTEADTAAEELIINKIKSVYPDHGFLAEESGRTNNNSEYIWIIDPLDGTTNFAHAYPFFSISIALEINGVLELGVVYDPIKNELFHAETGKGSYLNDQKINISNVDSLEGSLLVTGFVHEQDWMITKNLQYLERFIYKSQAFRRDGSAALDLCYVACGRFDGFWEMGLNPWDTAAGVLMVKEAGGKVTEFSGNDFKLESLEILASNGIIHDGMKNLLEV